MNDQPIESTPKDAGIDNTPSPAQPDKVAMSAKDAGNDAPKPTQPGKVEMPAELQLGCPLHLRINNLAGSVCAKQNGDTVYHSVAQGFYALSSSFDKAKQARTSGISPWPDGEPDCVLAYCVAHSAGMVEDADRFELKAMQMYLRGPDAYNLLLDDLIPNDFLAVASEFLAAQAYGTGTNPTALDDWEPYCSQLKKRRHPGVARVFDWPPNSGPSNRRRAWVDVSRRRIRRRQDHLGDHDGFGRAAKRPRPWRDHL